MRKNVRLSDIAERAGVSVVSVSKALNGKDGVSDGVRAKIKELAAEMGYIAGSSSKIRGSTGNIGVIVPARFLTKNNSFYWEMYERIVDCLMACDYYTIFESLRPEDEAAPILPRMIRDRKIDGVILMGQLSGEYDRFFRSNAGWPSMRLDSYNSMYNRGAVISDGYYGMYMMTTYLLENGHRDISFVGTVGATSSISDRYFGYSRAMLEYGIKVTSDMVIPDRDSNGVLNVTLPEELPTAFVCNCDLTAFDVIAVLSKRKLRVPEDISIVGFDNYLLPTMSMPSITTYAVDMGGMASSCVESLLCKISDDSYEPKMKIITGHPVIRSSVRNIDRARE